MIRGITEQDHEARRRRIAAIRMWAKRLWVVTVCALAVGLVAAFVEYPRPLALGARVPIDGFGLVINKANRDRPVIDGVVVRVHSGKGYLVAAAGTVLQDSDLGKPVDLWFPWLGRDQTLTGSVRAVYRSRTAAPAGTASAHLAVIEFDAGPRTRVVELWPRPVDSLRNAAIEGWGIDKKSHKAAKLATGGPVSRTHGNGYFFFPLKTAEWPAGVAALVGAHLAGIVPDGVSTSRPAGGELMAVAAPEINAAIMGVVPVR